MSGWSGTWFSVALAVTRLQCGTTRQYPKVAPPPAPTATVSSASSPKPLDCDALCTKANTVTGCATDAANVPACVDLCKRMLEGACKAQVEAELACAAKITLACKPEGTVDWGACVAEQRAANEC
ncbi:MAG: hypothetical protein ABI175_10840, partial [Polyangiales bacterium]